MAEASGVAALTQGQWARERREVEMEGLAHFRGAIANHRGTGRREQTKAVWLVERRSHQRTWIHILALSGT